MSYVRFGEEGSSVYIYPDIRGFTTCCACAFTPPDEDDFRTVDLDDMLAHIARHRGAGHVVPDFVDADMRADWRRYNDAEALS